MKVQRLALKHVFWEYIVADEIKEYADYLQITEEEAKNNWQVFETLGKKPAFETLVITGGYARGFGEVDRLLKELMDELQQILLRRWILGFQSVGQCLNCNLYFIKDEVFKL